LNLRKKICHRSINQAFRSLSTNNKDPFNNIPDGIWDLTQRKIYKLPNHPIRILIN